MDVRVRGPHRRRPGTRPVPPTVRRFLADEAATSVAGATDRGDAPVAAAFARAAHRITQERVHLA
ncbi:hypothetical protein ACIRJR_18945 [Streptomyces sp. NPDC102402]|uniref:hypothetical protein n=1 Tax=Streptomyces sp. NPDC102402 TaxID=3366169 RepID=UPI0037F2B580